jgi:hypothetical protein
MYHPTSISSLSPSQISKALKGLPVRVSAGNHHDIELSADQIKKFAKAGLKGKASTITLDPYQIQNHMHLMGAGQLKKNIRGNASRLISAGTDRAIHEIGGSVNRLKKAGRWEHFANATVRDGIDTAGKAARVYSHSMGGSVNRLKKAGRWEHFANATVRDGIDTAGKAARVYNNSMMGFGVKKRGRPRKHGGALMAAGY